MISGGRKSRARGGSMLLDYVHEGPYRTQRRLSVMAAVSPGVGLFCVACVFTAPFRSVAAMWEERSSDVELAMAFGLSLVGAGFCVAAWWRVHRSRGRLWGSGFA